MFCTFDIKMNGTSIFVINWLFLVSKTFFLCLLCRSGINFRLFYNLKFVSFFYFLFLLKIFCSADRISNIRSKYGSINYNKCNRSIWWLIRWMQHFIMCCGFFSFLSTLLTHAEDCTKNEIRAQDEIVRRHELCGFDYIECTISFPIHSMDKWMEWMKRTVRNEAWISVSKEHLCICHDSWESKSIVFFFCSFLFHHPLHFYSFIIIFFHFYRWSNEERHLFVFETVSFSCKKSDDSIFLLSSILIMYVQTILNLIECRLPSFFSSSLLNAFQCTAR